MCSFYPYELTLSPLRVLAFNFSLQYHLIIKHSRDENQGKCHQLVKLWIVKQILLISTSGNV